MIDQTSVTLGSGTAMPQLGFGVFQVPQGQTAAAVTAALEAGYRSIDTAAMYRNEQGVGAAIAQSGLAREELFVTTKLNNNAHGRQAAIPAFEASLQALGLDYVDLYLIHWPLPSQDRYVETWRALEQVHRDGRARAIGVSNFQPTHLSRLMAETETVPAVNQVEVHPYLVQEQLRDFDREHAIVTEAWSPLARGGELLAESALRNIAHEHGKTPAQVVIRWHLQLGNVVIPKSVTPKRIRENIDVFDFALTREQMADIASLNRNERIGPDPDTFNP